MTSPATVNCRGISLLKIGQSPSTDSEKEAEINVSVHQLSLYIWKLFKVPRGSVQKKIKDLGIRLRPCTKEGVQILRDHCVINAYKACQLTLGEAELVFDSVQKSRQRRANSEKRKQDHAEKRWLHKTGNKNSNTRGKPSDGQVGAENGLDLDIYDTTENVDGCALYKMSSPPTSAAGLMQGGGRNCVKNWESPTGGKTKTGTLMGVGLPFKFANGKKEEEEIEEFKGNMALKHGIGNGRSCSLWARKKAVLNGYKNHQSITSRGKTSERRNGQLLSQSPEMSECSEDSYSGVDPNGIENSCYFGYEDIDGKRLKVPRLESKEERKLQKQTRDVLKKRKLRPAMPKRIVKLRHFAQTTSPKVNSTISKPPCPSIGKHFPGMYEMPSEAAPGPLVVSIPRSVLDEGCNKVLSYGDCFSSVRAPASTTLVCSRQHGHKFGLRSYKRKVKETALSTFASKKRASTHTPSPPVEAPPEKHPSPPAALSLRDTSQELLSPKSPSAGSFSCHSGMDINFIAKSYPSKPRRPRGGSHKSNFSSSSNSPQPATPLFTLDSQSLRNCDGELDNMADSELVTQSLQLNTADLSCMNDISDNHQLAGTAAITTKNQPHGLQRSKNSSSQPPLEKDDEGFCFRKHFDSVPPRLEVRNGELCPEVSLSLKGVRLNDIPSNHPIWTWKVGQPTKKPPPPAFKVRTTRLKSKSKPPVL